MRVIGAAWLAWPGDCAAGRTRPRADVTPNINLIPELKSKTPEEKEQEAIKEKAYRESLKKIPDAKASNDPWGGGAQHRYAESCDGPPSPRPRPAVLRTRIVVCRTRARVRERNLETPASVPPALY